MSNTSLNKNKKINYSNNFSSSYAGIPPDFCGNNKTKSRVWGNIEQHKNVSDPYQEINVQNVQKVFNNMNFSDDPISQNERIKSSQVNNSKVMKDLKPPRKLDPFGSPNSIERIRIN